MRITTSPDTAQSSGYYRKQESGLMSGGGSSVAVGSRSTSDRLQTSAVTNTGSTIGSLKGHLSVTAGNDLHVTGSDLIAAQDVTGMAKNLTIDAAAGSYNHNESHETRQSGLTVGLAGTLPQAVQGAVGQAQSAGGSQDSRAKALHAIAAAGQTVNVAQQLAAGGTPDIGISVSVGSSHSKSTFTESQTTQTGSNVVAGGTAAFIATGDKNAGQGNLTIAGSDVTANNVLLNAANRVNLVNTTDTDSTRSTKESGSANVGVQLTTRGVGASASMARAHGDGNRDAVIQNNTHITGANNVSIVSGGDTSVIGATVNGKHVSADVGGNLDLASVQDTTVSEAHQKSSGGGFTISQGGGSANFSSQGGHASGSYSGVSEQAGIEAGDGGFNISVKGKTDLKGATIASTATPDRNSLTTGTLTFSDIANSSSYDAKSSGISAGASIGLPDKAMGPASVPNSSGIMPSPGQHDSVSDSATTRSGVSAGAINITDADHQTQDVASLNRDTSHTNGTVAKLPNVNNLLARQADMMGAASAAGQAVATQIGNYADQRLKEAQDAGDRAGIAAWSEGGTNRVLLHVAGGGLVAGLGGGSIGTAVQGAAGAGVSAALAGKLNSVADEIGGTTGSMLAGNIVSNVLASAGGALVGGSAGAFTASNADLYNRNSGNGEGTGGTGSEFLDRLGNAINNVVDDPWGSANYALNSVIPQPPGQKPDADANPLVDASNNSTPPATGGAVVTPPLMACSPNGACVVMPSGATPGALGYVPGNATLNSGNNDGANSDGGGSSTFWSPTKSKTPVENAYDHSIKHGGEFPEYPNSVQYVKAAQDFVNNPPAGTLIKTRSNGDTLYYDPSSDTFAVKTKDGAARTLFKPDPAQHGYPTNLDYFNAQK